MKGEYLSDVVDVKNDLSMKKLNLIAADCGAGKTTFAIKKLAPVFGEHKTAFLIDTKRGKKQLLKKEECIDLWTKSQMSIYMPEEVFDEWVDTQITVMTYAQFAYRYRTEGKSFLTKFRCIICDEIHNLANFMSWDDRTGRTTHVTSDNYLAFELIKALTKSERYMVVAMSATPEKFLERFQNYGLVNWVHPDVEFRHYETKYQEEYSRLGVLLHELDDNKRGLIYVPRIRMMENCEEILKSRGINAVCIWSENNKDHPMNKQQQEVSDYVVEHAELPDDVQVLIINKSSETSINIDTVVDYVVVHSMEKDVKIQARGRIRNDLDKIYMFNDEAKRRNGIVIDDKWLDKPLTPEDKKQLCEELRIMYRGKPAKWPTIKKIINESMFYTATDKKNDNVRFTIITEEL